ncbi:MAG: transglycosylase domain-containing protein [Sphingorhabdus sp.]
MKKYIVAVPLALVAALFLYGLSGWFDARSEAPELRQAADQLIAQGRGANRLSKENMQLLLAVEDPSFADNNGTDFSSKGAGKTTITQSLSKRLAFDDFKPGIQKIRQTGYAIGLKQKLSNDQILALFLANASFSGSDHRWTKSFHAASERFFAIPLQKLDDGRFAMMVAALIAPANLNLDRPSGKLTERVRRIKRLNAGNCQPSDHSDVWLEGCK